MVTEEKKAVENFIKEFGIDDMYNYEKQIHVPLGNDIFSFKEIFSKVLEQ